MNGDIRSRLESLRRSGELCSSSDVKADSAPAGISFSRRGRGGRNSRRPLLSAPDELFPGRESRQRPVGGDVGVQRRGPGFAGPGRSLEEVRPERSLFLDIETTGLSGGTGTWVFLIGLGWLKDDKFYLRQYFLRHPSEEKAMLSHFTETAAGFSSMVTFNGKSFDLPMIQTRQVLTGLPLVPIRTTILTCCPARAASGRRGWLHAACAPWKLNYLDCGVTAIFPGKKFLRSTSTTCGVAIQCGCGMFLSTMCWTFSPWSGYWPG
jgi:hypothetical protein